MNKKRKVLAVDESAANRARIQEALGVEFDVLLAESGNIALELIKKHKPSLLIVDAFLTHDKGKSFIAQIRSFSVLPIIAVSTTSGENEVIQTLEQGADDYIEQPFRPGELLARARTHIRRSMLNAIAGDASSPHEAQHHGGAKEQKASARSLIETGGLAVDLIRVKAFFKGLELQLTTREFQLLAFLAGHEGQVFSREQLLVNVWGFDYAGDARAVDSAVKRLRKQLRLAGMDTATIQAVRSIGYKFGELTLF